MTATLEHARKWETRNWEIKRLRDIYGVGEKWTDWLDFGAGIGTFTVLYAYEPNMEHFEFLKKKGFNVVEKLRYFKYIYAIDVLEHIEKDVEILCQLRLNCDRLFLYVPARQETFSKFDKSEGHYRRYSKEELTKKVEWAGFKVLVCKYHDPIGYLGAWVNKLWGYSARKALFYDKFILSFSLQLPVPIGKSLYLVGE